MGIIKAVTGAVGGVLADQWLEMYYCDSMPSGILAQKGTKRVGPDSSNTKGSEDVISDGSIIVVNEGQCALVTEMGKVIGLYSQPGENVFHSDRSPSIFSGRGLKGMGESIAYRVGFGGDVAIHQSVVYLNLKEQFGGRFSLFCPVSICDRDKIAQLVATVRMKGTYTFRIVDPGTFYRTVCGSSSGTVTTKSAQAQMEAEFATAAMEAVAKIGAESLSPTELSAHLPEVRQRVTAYLTDEWAARRGFKAESVAFEEFAVTRSDLRTLQTVERDKMLRDPAMAAATLVGAQAQAMESAARNPGGGVGLVGVNTAPSATPFPEAPKVWYCAACGKFLSSRFCPDCGAQRKDG